jgi:hypothetical protein
VGLRAVTAVRVAGVVLGDRWPAPVVPVVPAAVGARGVTVVPGVTVRLEWIRVMPGCPAVPVVMERLAVRVVPAVPGAARSTVRPGSTVTGVMAVPVVTRAPPVPAVPVRMVR